MINFNDRKQVLEYFEQMTRIDFEIDGNVFDWGFDYISWNARFKIDKNGKQMYNFNWSDCYNGKKFPKWIEVEIYNQVKEDIELSYKDNKPATKKVKI